MSIKSIDEDMVRKFLLIHREQELYNSVNIHNERLTTL